MKNILQIALIFFLTSLIANAQWNEGEERTPVPDTNWRGSSGAFGAMLIITDDPDGFFEQWNKPASPTYKPNISTVEQASRGDTVVAITLFTGCEADEKGNCASEIDFKVLKPDGSIYSAVGGELWTDKPRPHEGILQVSQSLLGFEVEAEDPLGEYSIEVVVRDKNSNKALMLSQTILVVP